MYTNRFAHKHVFSCCDLDSQYVEYLGQGMETLSYSPSVALTSNHLFAPNAGLCKCFERICCYANFIKCFLFQQMDRIFPWFKVKESRFWERQNVSAK